MKRKFVAALGAAILTSTFIPTDILAYWTGGYDLVIDGRSIATVKSEESVNKMVELVNSQLTSVYGSDAAIEPEYSLKAKIISSSKLTDMKELHDAIAAESDYMSDAVSVSIDGSRTICVRDEASLGEAIESVVAQKGVSGAPSGIVELVGTTNVVVPEAQIFSSDAAAEYFISENLITVKSTSTETNIVDFIPDAITVEDPDTYEGVSKTVAAGRTGSQELTTTVSYINGEPVETKLSSAVIDAGESAVIAVGTKARPAGVGSGSFSMPVSGKITSSYGARWGRNHNGIDIGASTGTPVYAADDGVVTCSEYKGSFGNIVKIDHQNGYETYYAHNSVLLVNAGDTVKKGELIAKVGSTGNSTGPHCHFEIHYNGEIKNPMNYLK